MYYGRNNVLWEIVAERLRPLLLMQMSYFPVCLCLVCVVTVWESQWDAINVVSPTISLSPT